MGQTMTQPLARLRPARPPRFRTPVWLTIGAGGLAAVLLGIIIYFATNSGTIPEPKHEVIAKAPTGSATDVAYHASQPTGYEADGVRRKPAAER